MQLFVLEFCMSSFLDAMALESEAAFQARALEVGISVATSLL